MAPKKPTNCAIRIASVSCDTGNLQLIVAELRGHRQHRLNRVVVQQVGDQEGQGLRDSAAYREACGAVDAPTRPARTVRGQHCARDHDCAAPAASGMVNTAHHTPAELKLMRTAISSLMPDCGLQIQHQVQRQQHAAAQISDAPALEDTASRSSGGAISGRNEL